MGNKKGTNNSKPKKNSSQSTQTEKSFLNEIIIILLFGLCVFLLLSCFGIGGTLGGMLSYVLFGLFGVAAYIFPIILFIGITFLISNKNNKIALIKFIAGALLYLAICNFACLSIMKNMEKEPQEQSLKFRDVIKNTFCNKGFISITVLTVLWNIAQGTTIGFLGIYKTKELAFSIATIQIINIVGNAARVVISRPLGRYSDKTSFAKGIKLAVMLAGAAFLINSFTTPETRWLIVVYTILHSCCIAGTNQNMYNITYSYVPKEYFSQALAIKNCIGGLFGFAASLVSGKIVAAVQANSYTIFGIRIYAQQVLSFISFLVCMLIIVYITLVVEKQRIVKQ